MADRQRQGAVASVLLLTVALAIARPGATVPARRDRGQASRPPPDSVATEFQTALRVMAWRAAAARMHPEGLDRFRALVDMLMEVDSTATRAALFPELSSTEYRALDPAAVLVRVLARVAEDAPGLLHALVVRDVEIIGAVHEPPDRAYAVYRSTARLSGAEPSIRVMTLKLDGRHWKVLETDELEVIRESLRGLPRRAHPEPRGSSPGERPPDNGSIRESAPRARVISHPGLRQLDRGVSLAFVPGS